MHNNNTIVSIDQKISSEPGVLCCLDFKSFTLVRLGKFYAYTVSLIKIYDEMCIDIILTRSWFDAFSGPCKSMVFLALLILIT